MFATQITFVGYKLDAVRACGRVLVDFTEAVGEKKTALKKFLFRNFYRHPNVMEVMEEAQGMLEDVFARIVAGEEKLPEQYGKIADAEGVERAAADYVAGMTDRFLRDRWREGKKKKSGKKGKKN